MDSSKEKDKRQSQAMPKMPATFDRWFWTADYRRGVTILFDKLNAGLKESQELIAFIRKRESFERAYAHELKSTNPLDPDGFGYDDGASFFSVYKQLRSSQVELADAHARLALQLDRLVIGPFETWSRDHQQRITKSIDRVELILSRWENQAKELIKLKEIYDSKTQEADEAEEDSRFSPASTLNHHQQQQQGFPSKEQLDSYSIAESTASPRETYGQITKLVSEQAIGLSRAVTQKMRIQDGRLGFKAQSLNETKQSPPENQDHKPLPESPDNPIDSNLSTEKGKSKEAKHMTAPPNTSLQPTSTLLNIAGVVKSPFQWSQLFSKAHDTIFKQSIKVPVLGTYHGAHSGEDLVIFFKNNLIELNGDPDRAIELCKELSQELSILRLIGEIGNKFIASHDAFYVWKPEAFNLHKLNDTDPKELEEEDQRRTLTNLPEKRHMKSNSLNNSPSRSNLQSSSPRMTVPNTLTGIPKGFEKQSSTGSALGKYIQTAVTQAAKGINELGATVGVSSPITAESPGETRAERLGREARSAEKAYSTGVIRLDHTRLTLEQTISEYFNFLQRCELDRLRAAKAVIMGFNAALATLNPKMDKLAEQANVLNESFSPENDVNALVERYKTGPFRPSPILFHSYRSNESRVYFGIDLSKWHNSQQGDTEDDFNDVPPILTRLLNILEKTYPKLSNDDERRKTWIYEVPLKAIHELREALNDPYKSRISDERLEGLDPPLIAATIKLWLLELDPPPVHSSRYEDVKAIYPQRGVATTTGEGGIESSDSVDVRVEVLANLLSKLPKPHLMVIDTIISHIKNLFANTEAQEDDDLYLTKLGLSIARTLLRPKVENGVTLSDRFQPMFIVDLIKNYDRILPVAIGLRNKMMGGGENVNEFGIKKPTRKNTRPTDMRIRRSELGIAGSIPDNKAQKILADQRRRVSQGEAAVPLKKSTEHVKVVNSPTSPQSVVVRSVAGTAENSPVDEFQVKRKDTSGHDSLSKGIDRSSLKDDEAPITVVANDQIVTPPSSSIQQQQFTPIRSADQAPSDQAADDQQQVEESEDETRDAPFVPPFASGANEPVDLPFVPPTTTTTTGTSSSNIANEIISAYGNGGGGGGSSSEIDEQDIPLTTKTNINRLSSSHTKRNSSTSSSVGGATGLGRKRGIVGSPKLRNSTSSKLINHRNSDSPPPPIPASTTTSNHSKAAPSVGSLRSQFEHSSVTAPSQRSSLINPSTTNNENSVPTTASTNRYRRDPPKV
ncbi:hypothetical protein Pst134EB_004504 [Puccinia striiformis f. sp. tritici]|nr:hypothetical protein Pst134EB_004504 [Puccinia striiformis f. sp. tritici]